MRRERAPWWRRRLGGWGSACAALVLGAIAVGFAADRTAGWLALQGGLLSAGAVAYLVGLVRSPD